MKQGTLFLQVTSILLLVGLLGLIFSSKYMLNRNPAGIHSEPKQISGPAPKPDQNCTVFGAQVGPFLLVLTPLFLLSHRADLEQKWVSKTLGDVGKDATFLYLHLFHSGEAGVFTFDPDNDRVQLHIKAMPPRMNIPLHSQLPLLDLEGNELLFFQTVIPEKKCTLKQDTMARILLCFKGAGLWPEVSGVIFTHEKRTVAFRPITLSYLQWESLRSGGPVLRGLFEKKD